MDSSRRISASRTSPGRNMCGPRTDRGCSPRTTTLTPSTWGAGSALPTQSWPNPCWKPFRSLVRCGWTAWPMRSTPILAGCADVTPNEGRGGVDGLVPDHRRYLRLALSRVDPDMLELWVSIQVDPFAGAA